MGQSPWRVTEKVEDTRHDGCKDAGASSPRGELTGDRRRRRPVYGGQETSSALAMPHAQVSGCRDPTQPPPQACRELIHCFLSWGAPLCAL